MEEGSPHPPRAAESYMIEGFAIRVNVFYANPTAGILRGDGRAGTVGISERVLRPAGGPHRGGPWDRGAPLPAGQRRRQPAPVRVGAAQHVPGLPVHRRGWVAAARGLPFAPDVRTGAEQD